MSDLTISISALQKKIDILKTQLEEVEVRRRGILEEIGHISYIIENAKTLTADDDTVRARRAKEPGESTKSVLLNILKRESREMSWDEIFAEFQKVRPDVKVDTMRVILSTLITDPKHPVEKIRDGNNFRYIYRAID